MNSQMEVKGAISEASFATILEEVEFDDVIEWDSKSDTGVKALRDDMSGTWSLLSLQTRSWIRSSAT